MSKKLFIVEIDVPANVSVKFIRADLLREARDITDSYETYSDKKLARPKVRRLKPAVLGNPPRQCYVATPTPLEQSGGKV